jgi:hypothetical protein
LGGGFEVLTYGCATVARRRQAQVPDEGLIVEARGENLLAVRFTAMASPCEVLLPSMSHHAALTIGTVAAQEAWRVEKKYSRYRDDSGVPIVRHIKIQAQATSYDPAFTDYFARRAQSRRVSRLRWRGMGLSA